MRYAAMLRGVNLGNVRIAMADLRRMGEDAGFTEVTTHLNSGNLLFTASRGTATAIAETLDAAIGEHLGRRVGVVVRTRDALQRAVDRARELFPAADEKYVAIAFLSEAVGAGPADRLGTFDHEEYVVDGGAVYLHYPTGQAGTRLTNKAIEKKLGGMATVRGVRSVDGMITRL